ncbi:UNKNOWN [Stylonychia lemnae]|uniref:Transmembrane protein n=1 Tax=Stylonychia lemnae TaxID=5949 RepID=A0A078ASZ0_STYLE|nr:UNKNOWN [Stylonychia lemnae]|eukprot:CDW83953.1 UNKNOWN [Stylonychia lemnae]
MSMETASIRPYLGACSKAKGADFADCKKGMIINRTLKMGDELIKLRDSLNVTTEATPTETPLINNPSQLILNGQQTEQNNDLMSFKGNNIMTIIVITSLIVVGSFFFLLLAYYSNFLVKGNKKKGSKRSSGHKNQQKDNLKLDYSSGESMPQSQFNLGFQSYQQLVQQSSGPKSFFENISGSSSCQPPKNSYHSQMYFMRNSQIPQLLKEDDVPKFKIPNFSSANSTCSSKENKKVKKDEVKIMQNMREQEGNKNQMNGNTDDLNDVQLTLNYDASSDDENAPLIISTSSRSNKSQSQL